MITDQRKNVFSYLSYDSDEEDIIIKKNDDTSDFNEDPINNNYDENLTILDDIINYIKNLQNTYPIIIIDGENLIGGPIQHRSSKVKRVFKKYEDLNKIKVLVVKKSGGTRRFKNYTGIDVPDDFIFISLHADNGTCPDDGFILELAHKLKNAHVVTDDEFENRESFNLGDLVNGTKLTTNIGIEGRYIPDTEIINKSLIKKKNINKRKQI